MSRPESMASGGYFPMPEALLPSVAALLRFEPPVLDRDGDPEPREWALVDPCAADGKAALALARLLTEGRRDLTVLPYFVELEAVRFAALDKACPYGAKRVLGDAFRLEWEADDRAGASFLFLNPPYDEGRLEARWLERFAGSLTPGGVLVFVLPSSGLEPVAAVLARHFTDLAAYRFPAEHFHAFRQVVLFGRRRTSLLLPDAEIRARVARWAADPLLLPELPTAGPPAFTVPAFAEGDAGFSRWQIAPLDLVAIKALARPWRRTERRGALSPFPGVLPPGGTAGLGARTFPVAMPLGEGHVPAALACGVMNGAALAPDDPSLGLPTVYAKAVFRKKWRVADTRSDQDGNIVGEVQVEAPELALTVLDPASATYHTPLPSAARTAATSLANMTAADVLFHYRRAFRGALRERCPALHDPEDPSPALVLPALARTLFTAQAEVTRAIVKLLKRERAALLLGEVGVGKSTVALAVAAAIRARRVLVVCPPHLLDSWQAQAQAVLPDARTVVLADVGDADAFARAPDPGIVIGLLAQTAGKLSHAWAGVGEGEAAHAELAEGSTSGEVALHRAAFAPKPASRRCPRCGEEPWETPAALAKGRVRCGYRPLVFRGPLAEIARSLATALLPVFADEASVAELFPEHGLRRLVARFARALADDANLREQRWREIATSAALRSALGCLLALASTLESTRESQAASAALMSLLGAMADEGATRGAARALYTASLSDRAWYGAGADLRTFARSLLLLLPPGGPAQRLIADELRALGANDEHDGVMPWDAWHAKVIELQGSAPSHHDTSPYRQIELAGGILCLGSYAVGDARLALHAFGKLRAAADIDFDPPCGEPLFQAVPRPRRVPLATYLVKRYPHAVDLAVIDEAHECANQDSAQSQAMAQFMGTRMLLLTGSVSNGYAVGLFAILWTISRKFRDEFPRDTRTVFGRTYGYARRYVNLRDGDIEEDVTGFGANSDRVERRRSMGFAPGVLPSLLLKHVLPIAVVLHMADLEVDLPPRTEHVEMIDPGEELGGRVRALRSRLVAQIKADRFTPRAGKLFGAMADEWSSADRASEGIGNSPGGLYRVSYPETAGGSLVAELDPMPADVVLPKEQRLLDLARAELAEGRAALVFVWHADCGLQARLARLLEAALGEPCPILYADKVPAKKREAWIEREILAKNRRLLLVNPVAVGTGLNVLTHFSTLIWYQPPGCLPKAMRQAEGRVYRIGQTRPTRIYWLLYQGTSQEILHRLLLLKVAESVAVDGLDPASALQASGVGTSEGMSGFDVGRAIFEAVQAEEVTPRRRLPSKVLLEGVHAPLPEPRAPLEPAPPPTSPPAPEVHPASVTATRVLTERVGRTRRIEQLMWGW